MSEAMTVYLSRAEVGRLFHVSPATVARWTRQGKLPYSLTLGGRRRYPRWEILGLVRQTERGYDAEPLIEERR